MEVVRFPITIISGSAYRFVVQQIFIDGKIEIYKVEGKNKSITIQSNRPLLRSKGLKRKKPDWKINEGELHNTRFLEKICAAIMNHIDK